MSKSTEPVPLRIDIVSDVVCPWCVIGYKQLQKALEMLPPHVDVKLQWHPFELNPRMPEEGQNLREHVAQKYGSNPEQSRESRSRLVESGKSLGFTFDYHPDMRMVNTFRAHQLLHWAGEQGRQTELQMALFEAFFSQREDVGDAGVLAAVAGRVGLDVADAEEVLADQRFGEAVRAEEQQWIEREVHAVPTFVFNNKYMVPGAQEAETFVRVITKLQASEAA